MGAVFLGLNALHGHELVLDWWQWVLIIFWILGIVCGAGFILYVAYGKFRRYWQQRHDYTQVPTAIAKYFTGLRELQFRLPRAVTKGPASFGVFLGKFDQPATAEQRRVLREWDIIVLDPLQPGVLEAIYTHCNSTHVLGRVDVGRIVECWVSTDIKEVVQSLQLVVEMIAKSFIRAEGEQSPFTGVLIADWQTHFQPVVLNELIKYLHGRGLEVCLEVTSSVDRPELEYRDIKLSLVGGIIFRNGTILPNGGRCDYYHMTDVREALKAVKCQNPNAIIMVWDTVDDNVELEYAVLKRAFRWCKYFNALNWIGHATTLTDVKAAETALSRAEPSGAMAWLKEPAVVEAQEIWRSNTKILKDSCGDHAIYDSAALGVPDLAAKLNPILYSKKKGKARPFSTAEPFEGFRKSGDQHLNPLNFASDDRDYTALGCFPFGFEPSSDDFANLANSQKRLKEMGLLKAMSQEEILSMLREDLHNLVEVEKFWSRSGDEREAKAVQELISIGSGTEADAPHHLEIYLGLQSGFCTDAGARFWSLYDVDHSINTTHIYVSTQAPDLMGTLLHSFLSSRKCSRNQCFLSEYMMSYHAGKLSKEWELPPRLQEDIESLSPEETLLLYQRLSSTDRSEGAVLTSKIRACCKYRLIDAPSLTQLKDLDAFAYLHGDVSAEDLVKARIGWYIEQGCSHLDPDTALEMFQDVDARLPTVLMSGQEQILEQLTHVVSTVIQRDQIDSGADFFALAVFCAMRKLAMEEVYMEVTDRNPLPNTYTDQVAVLVEMFAVGARCESYFGMSSNAMGKILSEKARAFLQLNQPPYPADDSTELPSAYAPTNVDQDLEAHKSSLPVYYRITFIGIFAIPALIDILMLSTVGRGLYLTAFMSPPEKNMATTALMVSLLLAGAFGTTISAGGSHYLYSMAFPSMNMFVLTRWCAGVAICFAGGIFSLIIIGVTVGFYAGAIFFLYLFMLSTYYMAMAALTIYQHPNFTFQSGRITVAWCTPILFISPILSMWIHHDIVVYVSVMYGFLIVVLIGARRVISKWSAWYMHIPCVKDAEIDEWYANMDPAKRESDRLSRLLVDLDLAQLPRRTLAIEVNAELNRPFWKKATTDEFVAKMSKGYEATRFLLSWYCMFTGTDMPQPYSTTWNLQGKAARDTLKDMQKGMKIHNAFIHWRHAGNEVWCGLLYFVVALLDKWCALISGGSLLGLSDAGNPELRLPVGLALAYYLMSAVVLDAWSQHLWPIANKPLPQPIDSLESLRTIRIKDSKARQKLYWTSLFKLFLTHLWALSVAAVLMWVFQHDMNATILFVAYSGAYTALLWYQYNKVFAGVYVLRDLLVAIACGLPVGLILYHFRPHFPYNGVIALAISTWLAALLSLWTAKIRLPRFKSHSYFSSSATYRSHNCIGTSPLSQRDFADIWASVASLPCDVRHRVDHRSHPGIEVMDILRGREDYHYGKEINEAIPSAGQLLRTALRLWKNGDVVAELVPLYYITEEDEGIRAISRDEKGHLHVYIGVCADTMGDQRVVDMRRNNIIIAETLLHATAECRLGFSPAQSILAELLARSSDDEEEEEEKESPVSFIPEGIRRQLESYSQMRADVITSGRRQILRHALLDLDCDRVWDQLPESLRATLLKRICGDSCGLTNADLDGLLSRLKLDNLTQFEGHAAWSNLGAKMAGEIVSYARQLEEERMQRTLSDISDVRDEKLLQHPSLPGDPEQLSKPLDFVIFPIFRVHQVIMACIRFVVLSLTADADYQRELDYVIASWPALFRWVTSTTLNSVWLFCHTAQRLIIPLVWYHNREDIAKLFKEMQGPKTAIERHRILIETLQGPTTGFFTALTDGTSKLYHYKGNLEQKPNSQEKDNLLSISTYQNKLGIRRKELYDKGSVVNVFTYEYGSLRKRKGAQMPIERRCVEGQLHGHVANFNKEGLVSSGSFIKDGQFVRFTYFYRRKARREEDLLRARYEFTHSTAEVSWCVPPPRFRSHQDRWIPYKRVMAVTIQQGEKTFTSRWNYDHKFHPTITTTLNGEPVETPPMVQDDWFKILQKPTGLDFLHCDPLFSFKSWKTGIMAKVFGLYSRQVPMNTSRARTLLWKKWRAGSELDAMTCRWVDENLLRSEPTLKPYWRARNLGRLEAAKAYLDLHIDTIMARVDIDPEVSAWTPLAFKMSDLYQFGRGGYSGINTRTHSTLLIDSDPELHVLAMDTGCWPTEGGGVSACRRDLVDNLKTTRWHVIAESANDHGLLRFQAERNVQSLKILPLWGLDTSTPTHGVFQDQPDSAIQRRYNATSESDIIDRFIPILRSLVRSARAKNFGQKQLQEATKALLDLNTYFETNRHWGAVWNSDVVKHAWQEFWLTEDAENTTPLSEWLHAERPTLAHVSQALDMWHRFLLIFSMPVPEKIPAIFQLSHHFVAGSYGVVCKLKRGCSLHVWDHGLAWREVNFVYCSAMSGAPAFVRTALISLTRMAATVTLHHADVLLPCANFFNPRWETEIGSAEGALEHRKIFARKIVPVVNGICDLEKFKPVEEIRTNIPTATMLSHVRYIKDIKCAILAADFIVNRWGFEDYQLHIYGDMERSAAYSVECQQLIASKSLGRHVVLKGLAKPAEALKDTWIFLNSSISEGLPLALGEAALTGAPVVCTDVGSSLSVFTDDETGKRYGAVVAPNDVASFARAEINVLAMLEEWAEFTNDGPGETPKLSENPTKEEVKIITERMYSKTKDRRRLGMRCRDLILKNYQEERYLREHEQMLWVGKFRNQITNSKKWSTISGNMSWSENGGYFKEGDGPGIAV